MKNKKNTSLGKCRFCNTPLTHTFVDLGMSPLCEDHLKPERIKQMESFYPLHTYVCEKCFLVQVEEIVAPDEIFTDYAYFSSYSSTWLLHIKKYTEDVIKRFNISGKSLVAELASNDGYLLQYFVEEGIEVLGIEPAANIAKVAIEKGIRTEILFFGQETAMNLANRYRKADLLIGNNVLAHVPDINDFVSGMATLLSPTGVITMEFPHLMKIVEGNQFDTIYQEHFSYLSFTTVEQIFHHHGLELFDVEEIPTHGGSLRIFGKHLEDKTKKVSDNVKRMRTLERDKGLRSLSYYADFTERVKETKWKILEFLINAKRDNKSVVGYGAPGKGTTLLNYCGVRTDFIDYTVDLNPHKQNKFLPGVLIPICHPDKIKETKPDYIFILPWNLKDEIMDQLSFIAEWGGQFVVPIPELTVYEPAKVLV